MAKGYFTDEQVEIEIERLRESPLVKLARREANVRNARRNLMYSLRCLEKRGRELAESGVTMEMLRRLEEDTE